MGGSGGFLSTKTSLLESEVFESDQQIKNIQLLEKITLYGIRYAHIFLLGASAPRVPALG